LVVRTNQIRERGFTLLSSSSSSRCDPKMEYLSCILAGHLPRKRNGFGSIASMKYGRCLRSLSTFLLVKHELK